MCEEGRSKFHYYESVNANDEKADGKRARVALEYTADLGKAQYAFESKYQGLTGLMNSAIRAGVGLREVRSSRLPRERRRTR